MGVIHSVSKKNTGDTGARGKVFNHLRNERGLTLIGRVKLNDEMSLWVRCTEGHSRWKIRVCISLSLFYITIYILCVLIDNLSPILINCPCLVVLTYCHLERSMHSIIYIRYRYFLIHKQYCMLPRGQHKVPPLCWTSALVLFFISGQLRHIEQKLTTFGVKNRDLSETII